MFEIGDLVHIELLEGDAFKTDGPTDMETSMYRNTYQGKVTSVYKDGSIEINRRYFLQKIVKQENITLVRKWNHGKL